MSTNGCNATWRLEWKPREPRQESLEEAPVDRAACHHIPAEEPAPIWTAEDEKRWLAESRRREQALIIPQRRVRNLYNAYLEDARFAEARVKALIDHAHEFRAALKPFDHEEDEQ